MSNKFLVQGHVFLLGPMMTGQSYIASELAERETRAGGTVIYLTDHERDAVPGGHGAISIHGLQAPDILKAIEQFEPSTPLVLVRDFSSRPTALQDTDEWHPLAAELKKYCETLLTVANSGASGRENPDATLFDAVWTCSVGFQNKNQMLRAQENHEVVVRRPNLPTLFFRSEHTGSTRFNLVTDERFAQ